MGDNEEIDLLTLPIMIIGDGGVGKTCLISVYAGKPLNGPLYIPTVLDTYHATIKVNQRECNIELYDTAFCGDMSMFKQLMLPKAEALMMCYSTKDFLSFQNIENFWVPEIRKFSETLPFVFIGTKTDLKLTNGQKEVSKSDSETLAAKCGAFGDVHTSAFDDINVKNAFHEAYRAVFFYKNLLGIKKVCCSII